MEIRVYEQTENIGVNVTEQTEKVNVKVEDNSPNIEIRIINEVVGDTENSRPVADSDVYVVDEDTTLTVDLTNGVLSNDVDLDDPAIIAELLETTTNGLLNFNKDGSFTYTPYPDFNGIDTFTYRAYDGQAYSAPSTVTITVNDTAEAPTAPTNLTFSNVGHQALTLTWTAGEYTETYSVDRRKQGGTWTTIAEAIIETSTDDSGLTAETIYEYRVRSFNSVGSAQSVVASITTAQAPLAYDIDYNEVLETATVLDVPHPDSAQKKADNELILKLKDLQVFNKEDMLFQWGGTADPRFRLICWKRRKQAVTYGTLTWSVDGVTGNGVNGYIDTLFVPLTDGVNWTLNDAGITAYLGGLNESAEAIIGVYGSVASGRMFWSQQYRSNITYFSINSGITSADYAMGAAGLMQNDRISAEEQVIQSSRASVNLPNASGTLPDRSVYALATNAGDDTYHYSVNTLKYLSMGANKQADYTALSNIIY